MQIFQNGYARFAFPCLGKLECKASASFNKAAMVSGDDLVCAIAANTECGIVVVVLDGFLHGLPFIAVMLGFITDRKFKP